MVILLVVRTSSDAIGVEQEGATKKADLQDVIEDLKRLMRKKFKNSYVFCTVQRRIKQLQAKNCKHKKKWKSTRVGIGACAATQ